MRSFIFASAVALPLLATSMILEAQPTMPEAPQVVQVQANPPGPGIPVATPPNPATAETPVAPAMPADPAYNAGPYKGALTAPPPQAIDKAYPLCTRTLQDSCVNPGEAQGRRANSPLQRRRAERTRR